MNTKNAKKVTANTSANKGFIKIDTANAKNVRVVEGKNGDVVFFTLDINGLTIYNCRVATGKNGDFISFPQYKDKNGKYWSYVYANLSPEDSNAILEEIQRQINEG